MPRRIGTRVARLGEISGDVADDGIELGDGNAQHVSDGLNHVHDVLSPVPGRNGASQTPTLSSLPVRGSPRGREPPTA